MTATGAADHTGAHQLVLPFGDDVLNGDGEEIEFHGTSVGIRRHLDADEPPCPACAGFLAELVDAGVAQHKDQQRSANHVER